MIQVVYTALRPQFDEILTENKTLCTLPIIKLLKTSYRPLKRKYWPLHNMNVPENLDTHNGNPKHDSCVNFAYHENAGELSDLFDDTNMDEFINNLNDRD